MQYTANYNLKKPDGTDVVNIQDLNDNADIIDLGIKQAVDLANTHTARHQPGGADALPTAAPSGGLGTANAVGTSTSLARADHTHLAFDSVNPLMNGIASPGTATVAARRDHVHPTDTTRAAKADLDAHKADYATYASAKDGDVYTVVDFKRDDGTLYLKSTLSNKDANGYFQTITLQYYDEAGTTVIRTVVWTLTYDADGLIISKVVAA